MFDDAFFRFDIFKPTRHVRCNLRICIYRKPAFIPSAENRSFSGYRRLRLYAPNITRAKFNSVRVIEN
jgi:hypothetical protein